MYFLTIQATAKPGTQQAEEAGGAYINCWVNFASQVEAERLARYYIDQSGWVPGEKMDERWVEADDYVDEPSPGFIGRSKTSGSYILACPTLSSMLIE